MSLGYLNNNKFWVGPCVERKLNINEESVYEGEMVPLISHEDQNFKLMFPIRKKDAQILQLIMDEEGELDEEQEVLGLFLTMADSWKSSDRIMAGAVLDSFADPELETDVFLAHFFLTNPEGMMESMVKSNFANIMILSALEGTPVFVTDKLLNKLLGAPVSENGSNPSDAESIIRIAQDIISGKPKKITRKGKNDNIDNNDSDDPDEEG